MTDGCFLAARYSSSGFSLALKPASQLLSSPRNFPYSSLMPVPRSDWLLKRRELASAWIRSESDPSFCSPKVFGRLLTLCALADEVPASQLGNRLDSIRPDMVGQDIDSSPVLQVRSALLESARESAGWSSPE